MTLAHLLRGVAIACCALFLASAAEAAGAGQTDARMHLVVHGVDRFYLIHVPIQAGQAARPAGGFPLVLAFHGGGGFPAGMVRMTRLDALADEHALIVAYPAGIDRHWNDGRSTIKSKTDDIGFVNALLDAVERQYPIDRNRVFATGISNGALFVQRLGCALAGRIRAIAAVAGPMPADIAAACHPAHPVSVLQIEGVDDPIMPYDGGKVADFGGIGEGGIVLSTQDTIALWGRVDGCQGRSAVEALPARAKPDGTDVTRTQLIGCRDGTSVELLTIHGGGHAWPGGPQFAPRFIVGKVSRQLDATAAIVAFFLIGN